jgi:hypothetical protein
MTTTFRLASCLASIAALASIASAQQVVINFDGMQGAVNLGGPNTPVPAQFLVNTQFLAQGVRFDSGGGGIGIGSGSNSPSAPNVAVATAPGPVSNFTIQTVTATFECNGSPAVVDTVSITLTNSSSQSGLKAYGLAGNFLGATQGGASQTLTVTYPGQIHSVVITQGPMAFDDFTFSPAPSCAPHVFCTAGTTSNGCVPSIGWTGTPSASSTSGFTIRVNALEGLKTGLIFYGIDNSGFAPAPWSSGSSFMCIKQPVQRTAVQNSGGTLNGCDGVLTLDWNAYRATHPSAIGSPFAAGQHVFAQGWFRDPPSPKGTMLSNALEFGVGQ